MKFKHKHLPFPPKNPSSERSQRNKQCSQQHSPDQVLLWLVWPEPQRLPALPELNLLLFPWAAEEKWDVSLQREVLNIWVAWGTNGSLTPKMNNHSAWGQWELSLCKTSQAHCHTVFRHISARIQRRRQRTIFSFYYGTTGLQGFS